MSEDQMREAFDGHVVPTGTKVRITELGDTRGYLVAEQHMSARRAPATGTVWGYIPGHGGDVYGVIHDDDPTDAPMGVYGWWEFDLA